MAIFIDLDGEDPNAESPPPTHLRSPHQDTHIPTPTPSPTPSAELLYKPNRHRLAPNLTSLAIPYPVIYSIATNLDLNDLSNLASTCRLMRETMLQYRKTLLGASLTCSAAEIEDKEAEAQMRGRRTILCVKDLVARCGTCGEPACRNCVFKPGKPKEEEQRMVRCRITRLCRQCQTFPEVQTPNPSTAPENSISHKICTCPSKLLWQCYACRTFFKFLSTRKSFLSLLHHEKLQQIESGTCTHFNPPFRPPNSVRVWVEECPSPIHNHPQSHPLQRTNKSITCAMELYNGGWAYQDLTTGYIYRPQPESCFGATAEWWRSLTSDPNKGGFSTYQSRTSTDVPTCTSPTRPRFARMAGRGQDSRNIVVALVKVHQVSKEVQQIIMSVSLKHSKTHGLLEDEMEGRVRGWCMWCEGVVLAKDKEVGVKEGKI